MATYLITGATGLIGKALVRHLLQQDECRLILPVRNVEKAQGLFGVDERICYVLHDFDSAVPLNVDGDVDFIVHGACPTDSRFMAEHPVETINCIVNGTRTILELAKEKNVKSVVYLSSIEVYGIIADDTVPITEDVQGYVDPLLPRSSYPMGKRIAEAMCAGYASEYGVPVRIARLTQTFGPGVDLASDNRVFAQFARCARNSKDIILRTRGLTQRMYLHVWDAVEAVMLLLHKGANGVAYNVANAATYISVMEMALFVKYNFNDRITIHIDQQFDSKSIYLKDIKLKLSTDRIEALGWKPKYGVREMFEGVIG